MRAALLSVFAFTLLATPANAADKLGLHSGSGTSTLRPSAPSSNAKTTTPRIASTQRATAPLTSTSSSATPAARPDQSPHHGIAAARQSYHVVRSIVPHGPAELHTTLSNIPAHQPIELSLAWHPLKEHWDYSRSMDHGAKADVERVASKNGVAVSYDKNRRVTLTGPRAGVDAVQSHLRTTYGKYFEEGTSFNVPLGYVAGAPKLHILEPAK